MKNKTGIIICIVLLVTLCISLAIGMIALLKGNFRIGNIMINHKTSTELVIDKKYEQVFEDISIKSNASDIEIKIAKDDKFHLIIYGTKEYIHVTDKDNVLEIVEKENSCIGFCFNMKIGKIEVYVPESYEQKIYIDNAYGHVTVESLPNAEIEMKEDCGNISIESAKKVDISNDYGNVTIGEVDIAAIKVSAGTITIDKVNNIKAKNDYGNITIKEVNYKLDLENDCGDIEIDKIILSEDSYIKDDYGSIRIGETNELNIYAQTDLGKVRINKNYPQADIILKIENDCGDITVKNS